MERTGLSLRHCRGSRLPWVSHQGLPIELPENLEIGTQIFQAGTRLQEETLVTSGGRVLGVTAQAEDIEQARNRAYKLMKEIKFKGKQYRTDIGAKAL